MKLQQVWSRSIKFLREVRSELRRVQWPGRRESGVFTAVVVVSAMAVALAVWLVDSGLSLLIAALVR